MSTDTILNFSVVAYDKNNIGLEVHSPTNELLIKFEKVLKLTLKFTLRLLLHVSVYDHHQCPYTRAWLKLYYNSVNVTSLPHHRIAYNDVTFTEL